MISRTKLKNNNTLVIIVRDPSGRGVTSRIDAIFFYKLLEQHLQIKILEGATLETLSIFKKSVKKVQPSIWGKSDSLGFPTQIWDIHHYKITRGIA